jgi:hypothetical protein
MRGSSVHTGRVDDLVRLSLGEPEAVAVAVRSRADQVLARLGEALRPSRSPDDRIEALIETYMHAALKTLADAAPFDRIAFAEAEVVATAVAAAMDRAADAAAADDPHSVAAAMAAAESVLDLDLTGLYELLL